MIYEWEAELPELAELSDAAAAEAINAMTVQRLRPLNSAELLAWAAGAGRLAKLEDACQSPDAGLRSVATVARLMLMRSDTALDLNVPDRQALLNVLIAGGVLSEADRADLIATATVTEPKYVMRVGSHHVHAARAGEPR